MLLVVAGLLVGQSAWGETTTIYERGTTNAWADADLTDWSVSSTSTYLTYSINGGLYLENTSAKTNFKSSYSTTKTISPTENSIVTMTAVIVCGYASGRTTSYDYVTIGGAQLRVYGQAQTAQVYIDGTEQGSTVSATRGGAYTFNVEINQATGAVTYSVSGGATIAEASTTTSTAISNVVIGHSRGGSESYNTSLKLTNITITEEAQEVTTADYTINYIYNESTIKTTNGNIALGTVVEAENPITVDDVKYYIKDGETTSMTIVDGTNVLDVDMRLADTYGYTVRGVDGSSNVLDANLASGSVAEGESVTVSFPRYILSGTTLYCQNTGAVYYSTTFTPDGDAYVKDITYSNSTVSNVAFYTEAEDVNEVTSGTNADRASMGEMGYTGSATTYKDVTTLSPGKYILYMRGQNGNSASRAYSFKVGDTEVFSGEIANGTNQDANSDEFTVSASSTLSFASEGSSSSGVDYFYLVKTAVPVTLGTNGYATFASPYPLDLTTDNLPDGLAAYTASVTGTTVSFTKLNQAVPAYTGVLLKGTASTEYSIPVVASGTEVESNAFLVNTSGEVFTGDDDYYYFALKKNTFTFATLDPSSVAIPANKAYLKVLKTAFNSASRSLSLVFDDEETTGIISNVRETEESNQYYNLSGQRISKPAKGLYIHNGKKFVVK